MAVSQSLKVEEISVDTTNNTSQVRILWTSTQTGESWNGYTRTAKYYVSINGGAETEYSVLYSLPQNTTTTILNTTITVPHKADGSGMVGVRTWMDTGISAGVIEKSGVLNLTLIPRATTLDFVSETPNYLTSTITYKYTPKAAFHYNRCVVSVSANGKVVWQTEINHGQQPASQQTANLTIAGDPLSSIYNALPSDAQGGYVRIEIFTYSDPNYRYQVGEADGKVVWRYIPNDATTQPTVGMSLSPVNSLKAPYNGLYIQGISKVKAALDPRAKFSATIVASSITVDGKNYESPYESDILPQAVKVTVKATVKDSRGFYGTNYKDIEVIPYSKPYVSAYSAESRIIAARCDASASFTNQDSSQLTYLKIKAKAVFSKIISNGVQNNYGNLKFRYRQENGAYSAWETILKGKEQNSDEVITGPLLEGRLAIDANYQVQIVAFDDLGLYESDPITIAVPSTSVYMHRPAGGKSMGLGGYAQGDGNLDIHWKTKARGGLSLYDSKGDEIPLDSTLPIPRDQVKEGYDPDNLQSGVYVVANSIGVKSGSNTIMSNGVLIQVGGTVGDSVKIQLTLPVDSNRSPMYRVKWFNNWSDWRSMKL
jgi:hypothetical protein